ncbi:hypothetical protein RGUI_1469 [Rhodovulum sp. P5]|uniref:hypothetical protein n=1 Tax=Rhodovulum sp. P5 TaxID=1564506 RepID=UPI0009C1D3D3|nr:hypothetical protein [Rhodovulum sp. P5]ARE39610.1 hypothetical protein RGUI_1469 [Rhodovulum sp. P5]
MQRIFLALIGMALVQVLWAPVLYADIPMAPLIGWARLQHAWVILLAIGIEAAAIKWLFALGWRRAAVLSVVVNAVTAALGLVVYPVLGMGLYPLIAPLVLGVTYGSPAVEAGVALAFVTLVDTAVELALLRVAFGLAAGWGRSFGFLLANALSAALLLAVLAQAEGTSRMPDEEVARLEATYAPEIAFMQQIVDDLDAVYAAHDTLSGTTWAAETATAANDLRFRRLYVAKKYAHYLVFGSGLHSTAERRGDMIFRRGRVDVWRSATQGGVWYYGYTIHGGRGAHAPRVTALFDRP